MSDDRILTLDAFVRAVGVNRGTPHACFFGAGTSITSGIPSAEQCVWEWKRNIFLTNNPGFETQFAELSLPSVRERIQRWLDQQGGKYPQLVDPREYGFYIEHCYPIGENRRQFFQEKIRAARPHTGYRLLCCLAEASIINTVWTTNFDSLTPRAAAEFKLTPVEVGIDTKHRLLTRAPSKGEMLCVSLHGDYRYDSLKNTAAEIRQQEADLCNALIAHLQNTPFVICGYSGRDDSIMQALAEGYSKKGKGALFWCGQRSDVPSRVGELIDSARKAGNTAYYIPTLGFDDLLVRLALHCLTGKEAEPAQKVVSEIASVSKAERSAFQPVDLPTAGLIKSNAFEIHCPSEVFQFELKQFPKEKVWAWFDEFTANKPVVAVPFHSKVLCLGLIDQIKDTFGDLLAGTIERIPITERDIRFEDGVVVNLLRRALVQSIAATKNLGSDDEECLWDNRPQERRSFEGVECNVHESGVVSLKQMSGKTHFVLMPSVKLAACSGQELSEDFIRNAKLSILGWQHNAKFNQAMSRWRNRLFQNNPTRFEYPPNCGSTFAFVISTAPSFAKIGGRPGTRSLDLGRVVPRYVRHSGFQLDEPKLVFSNKQATGVVKDVHPIRGIVQNRPNDFSLTLRGLASNIRIAVVCPQRESGPFSAFFQQVCQRQSPGSNERDYLIDYPGFQTAFGIPIEMPTPRSQGWAVIPEPANTADAKQTTLAIARSIRQCIDALKASYAPNVIIICFPQRWMTWQGYETDDESFDLHDFIKAYCVQQGIATQFLQEETLIDQQRCRVWWWLSLAIYVKSMRTPWVLDGLDTGTAFVGLGYSLRRRAERGQHVLLGCSHIYNPEGIGLQYRLTKIENPVMMGKNPFMSKDDARRVGETIRQLFFNSKYQLPRRVVLHKRTPFIKDEREGLLQGLGGVEQVDMLEINIDPTLRYVASVPRGDGKFDEDNYPVRRGTVVRLDDFKALVWVHGATTAVNPSMKYYQGKRRIPAPLVVIRHAGNSSLPAVAEEILGLSKMNWNTFDLYTKLPATVQSSGEIARIGALLERFGENSYDYRLFI